MIKIAVCDDEMEICSQIEEFLKEILEEKQISYETEVFYTGESLCRKMKEEHYALVFLDIELPNKNGVWVGSYIRETLKDEKIQIAYISSKTEYAMELFDYRPINFLVKPLNKEKIQKVIDKYYTIFEQDNHMFVYKKRGSINKVPLSDILYFENHSRKVTIVTLQGEDSFYDSMDGIYRALKEHKFLFIHKSIIVNYHHIVKFGYEQVTMANGAILSISQSRRKEIRSMFMHIREEEL